MSDFDITDWITPLLGVNAKDLPLFMWAFIGAGHALAFDQKVSRLRALCRFVISGIVGATLGAASAALLQISEPLAVYALCVVGGFKSRAIMTKILGFIKVS